MTDMIDPFGRAVTYLRVSVTDRCDFRCHYCMSEDMTFLPKTDVLSLEELDRLCSAFVRKGVKKLRITGGEPLVRRNIMQFISALGAEVKAGNLDELTITTNGSQLGKMADDLYVAGVRRINISLDTLDKDRFRAITRWGDLAKVMAGLHAAKAAGLQVKTVAQIRSIFFGMDQGVDELRTSDVKGANPFKDQRVREAFNLAIDKKAIQRVVMEGLSFPTGMITPPGVLGNTPENDPSYGFDVNKAKELMAAAGYGDGFQIQLDCPNNRYNNDEKICQAAVAMLAKIGVKVNLDAIPKAQHFPKIQKRTSDFYMLGWGVPTLDSHYVFSYLLASEGSWNATGYNNARVNEITDLITTETDIEKRTALIDEAWTLVRAEMPYVPIHHQVLAWGMTDKVDVPIASDDAFRPRYTVMK